MKLQSGGLPCNCNLVVHGMDFMCALLAAVGSRQKVWGQARIHAHHDALV